MFSRPFKRAVQVLIELERERYCAKSLTVLELKSRLRCNTYDRDILKVLKKLVSAGLVGKTVKNGRDAFCRNIELSETTVYDLVKAVDGGVYLSHDSAWKDYTFSLDCSPTATVELRLEKMLARMLKNIMLSEMITVVPMRPISGKRGPGRPSKTALAIQPTTGTLPAKRRGRPRKNPGKQ